jgi:hypothetical protein
MSVFISWSGDKSKPIAEEFREWLPQVIQAVRPFCSVGDLEKGSFWQAELQGSLNSAIAGIIIVTPENIEKPWLNFEAGALCSKLEKPCVTPLLFNVEKQRLTGPMATLQAAEFNVTEVKQILEAINSKLEIGSLASKTLDRVFETFWPKLEESVSPLISALSDQAEESQENEAFRLLERMGNHLYELTKEVRLMRRPASMTARIMGQSVINLLDLLRRPDVRHFPREQIEALTPEIDPLTREIGIAFFVGEESLQRLTATFGANRSELVDQLLAFADAAAPVQRRPPPLKRDNEHLENRE